MMRVAQADRPFVAGLLRHSCGALLVVDGADPYVGSFGIDRAADDARLGP